MKIKALSMTICLIAPFFLGCQVAATSNHSELSKTPEKIVRDLLRQSNEVVSGKRTNYDSSVQSSIDPVLLGKISSLKRQIVVAKDEAQGSGVSTFDIDTIPQDLILLRRQIPDEESIVRFESFEGDFLVAVREKIYGDGRSEGYAGEVLVLFRKTSHSTQLKDIIFRRYKDVPEWRLSNYLSDQEKRIAELRQRL